MPTSNLAVWPVILHLIETSQSHKHVLDVGPGFGKAATLLREYLNDKPERIVAVEAWRPYIDDHKLDVLYDFVLSDDVCNLSQDILDEFDLVLMADVIEHIDKDKALALLDRIKGEVVISTPQHFFHNGDNLPPTEAHVSHWTTEDFGDRLDVDASQLGGVLVRLKALA